MAYWRYFGNLATSGSLAGNNYKNDSNVAGFPSTGDDVEFGSDMAVDATAGLDALITANLANVFIKPQSKNIGTSAGYARIQCSSIDFSAGGGAGTYITISNGSAVPVAVTNGPTGQGVFALAGKIDFTRGVSSGAVQVNLDPVDSVTYPTSVAASAFYKGTCGVTVAASVTLNGGTLQNNAVFTTSSNAGNWTLAGGEFTTAGTATAGTVNNLGSRFNHGSTGNITALTNRFPATFIRSANQNLPYTITTLKMDGNSQVTLGARCTVTNPVELLSTGAGPILPSGTTLTFTLP